MCLGIRSKFSFGIMPFFMTLLVYSGQEADVPQRSEGLCAWCCALRNLDNAKVRRQKRE
jgi:hypothetical protein